MENDKFHKVKKATNPNKKKKIKKDIRNKVLFQSLILFLCFPWGSLFFITHPLNLQPKSLKVYAARQDDCLRGNYHCAYLAYR